MRAGELALTSLPAPADPARGLPAASGSASIPRASWTG